MRAFIVPGKDRPGELATVAEAIAERGINITGISCIAWGGAGAVGLITNDEPATRSALGAKGLTFHEVELVPCQLEDKPGTLAETARKLANAGINIELMLPTGMRDGKVTVAFGTSDAARTRELVGAKVLAGA
jgi:hypothetical protein